MARILIGCEFSGIVRSAFAALRAPDGKPKHEVWSCDLLDCEKGEESGLHHTGDVLEVIKSGFGAPWDMGIFFPPCTFVCNSSVRWLFGGKGKKIDGKRWAKMILACEFFNELLGESLTSAAFHIPKIAVENPIQHRYARERIRKYDQVVQPWMFGHPETKATCLWLKGLKPLEPTRVVKGRTPRVHHASPGPDRWKERSRTLTGLARAMAKSWG